MRPLLCIRKVKTQIILINNSDRKLAFVKKRA